MDNTLVIRTEKRGVEGGYRGLDVNIVCKLDGIKYSTNGKSFYKEDEAFLDLQSKKELDEGLNYILVNYDYEKVRGYELVTRMEERISGKSRTIHPISYKEKRDLNIIVEEDARKAMLELAKR